MYEKTGTQYSLFLAKRSLGTNAEQETGNIVSRFLILGLFLLCISSVPAKADGFKEGKWSMTLVTHMDTVPPEMAKAMQQMQNMPAEMQPQIQAMMQAQHIQTGTNGYGMTTTATQCLTKQNPVLHNSKDDKMDKYCQHTHDFQGNIVTFHTTCSNDDFDSSGSMMFTGDTMQGHVKSHHVEGGKPINATIDITGQYLGACDK